jgi:metallo-beta-lactamase class B
MAEMKRLTGARFIATEADAGVLESGGKSDFRWGQDSSAWFAPVSADEKLRDGQVIALGGTSLTVHIHPGHTKGAASFTFDVDDSGRTWHVLIANMPSINPGVTLLKNPKYPTIAADYARTFREQKALVPEIWLSSHASQFGLHTKYKPGDPYQPARFVDPAGYRTAVERLEKVYLDQITREQKER